MKTSITKRLLRLGILCAGIGSFAVAAFAAGAINVIESQFAESFGNTVLDSVNSSLNEEFVFLPDGMKTAVPGEEHDIFDNVFVLGESRSYDYSSFRNDCSSLKAGECSFTYLPSAGISLFAMNRGSETLVGELKEDYFDYAISIMESGSSSGYIADVSTGKILISTNKSESGSALSSDFAENLSKAKAGSSTHTGGPFSKYVIYSAPLKAHPQYAVFYSTDSSNIYRTGNICAISLLGWALVLTTIGVVVSVGVSKKIAGSITPTAECLDKFSKGIIDASFKANDRGDETQILSEAMEQTITNLGAYIKDIDFMLSEISGGNLTAQSSCDYAGDFNNIKNSLDNISSSLKNTIEAIREAGAQVNSGVGSLASGAQSLADNSSTEASTLKDLDALVKNINENINSNAEMTDRMRKLSETTVQNVNTGNENMKNLSGAIEDIRKASEEIQSIAKLIDDIAFQTNILALNAAVEAARAGDAGKGFAVVADEVRNLASKSADAAKDAVQVIGRCVAAVDQGVQLNRSASESLEEVSRSINEFSVLVGKVADSSSQQARDMNTVNDGLTSITSVVQSNAATAQQSAASSEELASQAQILDQQLSHFRV